MGLTRREFFVGATGLAAGMAGGHPRLGLAASAAQAGGTFAAKTPPVVGGNNRLWLPTPGIDPTLRVMFVGDAHCSFVDERDEEYRANYTRMLGWAPKPEFFEATLKEAVARKSDLLLLAGDLVSYPTLANVDRVTTALKATKLDWLYTAGNHDWHFENLPCSDENALRRHWIEKRLLPFYSGADPDCSSRVVKGVRFVAVDNSTFSFSEKQLAFLRSELARGEPTVVFMHIPLYVPGWTESKYVSIWWEGPAPAWAREPDVVTRTFCRELFAAENLVVLLTAHQHAPMTAVYRGQRVLSADGNLNFGRFWDMSFCAPGGVG